MFDVPSAAAKAGGTELFVRLSDSVHRQTFDGLNALRGIAALGIVLFHGNDVLGFTLVGNGVLAVDFFFLLSGFVIAHAYDERLHAGMSLKTFMVARLARFYPMYLVGALIGILIIAGIFVAGDRAFPEWQPFAALLLGMLFLPMPPSQYSSAILYPLNLPAWSLAVELAVNATYAALFRWMNIPVLLSVAGSALVALFFATALGLAVAHGGAEWSNGWMGYTRALFSFPLGVVIYRTGWFRHSNSAGFMAAAIVLAAALAFVPPPEAKGVFQLVFIVAVSPLILIGGLGHVPNGLEAFGRYLGRTSYPIYAIHVPCIVLTNAGATQLGLDHRLTYTLLVAALLTVCWWFDRLDERWRKKVTFNAAEAN